jgi:hypothetical protein
MEVVCYILWPFGLCMYFTYVNLVYYVYGNLVYPTAIWYLFWPFGIIFGMLYQEKSGNPAAPLSWS